MIRVIGTNLIWQQLVRAGSSLMRGGFNHIARQKGNMHEFVKCGLIRLGNQVKCLLKDRVFQAFNRIQFDD